VIKLDPQRRVVAVVAQVLRRFTVLEHNLIIAAGFSGSRIRPTDRFVEYIKIDVAAPWIS
jgi:hypothetical protein